MGSLRFALMTLLAMLCLATGAPAHAQGLGDGPHIAWELIPETTTPAPGGEVTLALAARPETGWHGYWVNPGTAGVATRADWTLPAGVTAGPLVYPVPQRLTIAGLMNYVYERPFTLFATLKLPDDAAEGQAVPIAVHLDYLVCTDEICVPESADLKARVTVGMGHVPDDRRMQFDAWRADLPTPLNAQATYQVEAKAFRLQIPFPAGTDVDAAKAYFFPLTKEVVDYDQPQRVARDGDRLIVEAAATARAAPGPIEGVLALGDGRGFTVRAMPGDVAPAQVEGMADGGSTLGTALLAFFGAVLGGLILNIMPCVFPILSLKALSLAKTGGGAQARGEALAYTAGVVLVCLLLGGILLGLRAAGASVGWAFQLQDPRVILILLLLVGAIALNLAGLFEFATPRFIGRAAESGTGGAFATGALAAFIATPCTGPFMGAALGAALVLPWPAALAIFGGLGLGIALPFLLIGFVPALQRRLPRPGAWMTGFRHILSIPMFLTAVALAWVLGRQTGVDGMAWGLILLLALALVLWGAGRRQARGLGFGLPAAILLAVVVASGVFIIGTTPATSARKDALTGNAEPFTEARLAELRGAGRPVFAYFTADWCLTCKVNERAVIDTAPVAKALADGKVAVLVGDWTNGDPALGRFIQEHNRAGVPLYLWYVPGEAQPRVLPQILTQDLLRGLASGREERW